MTSASTPGRPRDGAIDRAVLDATLEALARVGYGRLSLSAVAAEAGTTRPALYRRWSGKVALVVDAVAHLAAVEPPARTGDPYHDLVGELAHFRHCIEASSALPLAGLVLGDAVDAEVRRRYLELVVAPRRERLRSILREARDRGLVDADADLAIAGSMLTGSWYALALVGADPPPDWARRTATLVWRSCGGTVPDPEPSSPGSRGSAP